MGNFMREYWFPGLKSDELPEPDCAPVRIKLLGEELVAFRDTDGHVGLVDNYCPHRRASLFFGRNEECGLRCVYHGWKFDVNGDCVDMPSEPAESNFKGKVKIKAYQCQERNGVVWTYMGSRPVPPPLPELEGNMHDSYHITVLHRPINWMQGLEGEMDTLHVTFLHLGHLTTENTKPGTFNYHQAKNREGKFDVRETPHGTSYGMFRATDEGQNYWRVGHILFPFYAMVPGIENPLGANAGFIAYVPMDDHHTLEWSVRALKPGETPSDQLRDYLPNGTDWYGRYKITQNFANDFLIDREAQRANTSFTGIKGVRQQDMAVTESMGSIYDRTKEHLGTTDQMIIRTRRRFMAAARALAEDGTPPPGVDTPTVYHQRSGQVALAQNLDWWEATKELREAFNVEAMAMETSG
jgi:phenylpropionate dioxygenase-like ring-hydroxylating dioxygenase large terminal subunit